MYVIQTVHSDSLQTGPRFIVLGRAFLCPREDLEQVGERLAGVWHYLSVPDSMQTSH